ncbi:EndoU domain-containing protein [Halosaccharopolyspora lacisalsi]|uniref:EndoU domain-containing protein n=1 Tax=Halosaccharopolyspora lacisalsi TaxID=1000566 RepID=UPI0015F9D792
METGGIKTGEPEFRDSAGRYQAPATATTRGGKQKTRSKTFFPDHRSTEKVRHALREAFVNRYRVHYGDGTVIPNTWRGAYRSVTTEGMIRPGQTSMPLSATASVRLPHPRHVLEGQAR